MKKIHVALAGFTTAAIPFVILLLLYMHFTKQIENLPSNTEESKKEELTTVRIIDIVGTVATVLISVLFWMFFAVYCKEDSESVKLWPHLAFRYGLGIGIFVPVMNYLASNQKDTLHSGFVEFFPLLVLALIFASYIFVFLEIAVCENCVCKKSKDL